MATALYRRYRPETFSEMIGQAHVTEPLMTALRTGRVGHAYLFSGPRGCGKTTSARVLARCLNCAEGPTDTPCGVCPSCVELSRDGGGSLDVVEIDAASHGGVDDARELRERAVFAPARDRFKIFIIDEAHMVTSGGFNALLKIVEEPPPHVKFVFATTEPEKVIGTIRSRTHHYPFRLIAPGTLVDYAQQLVESEGVSVEPGVLPLVVRAGGGSVRDTLSILDQLIAGSEGDEVGLDRATGLLGYTSTELLDEVVAAFGAHDSGAAFTAADRVVQTGQDPRRFVEDLLERLRDLIVVSATSVQGASAVFRGVPVDRLQRMYEQAQAFGPGELSRIADTVSGALDRMTGATSPRLHLELMIARAIAAQAAPTVAAAPAGTGTAAARGSAPAPAGSPSNGLGRPGSPAPSGGSAAAPGAPAPGAPGLAAPAPGPSAPAAPATPEIDIVSTMRSARDFLRNDSGAAPRAGAPAQRPDAAPSPDPAASRSAGDPAQAPVAATSAPPASQQQRPAVSEQPASGAASSAPGAASSAPDPVGLDELLEVWPDLLEELLEEDRDAWNAVRGVQPLSIVGEVLTVGISSRSDLEAFKTAGSAPLREAIAAALGIRVKYVPKQVSPGSQSAARESASDPEPSPPAETAPPAADRSPKRGTASGPLAGAALSAESVPARAESAPFGGEAPRSSENEVAREPAAAPAPERIGEFGDPGFRPDRDPYEDPAYDPDLRDEGEEGDDPYAISDPYGAGRFDGDAAAERAVASAPDTPALEGSAHEAVALATSGSEISTPEVSTPEVSTPEGQTPEAQTPGAPESVKPAASPRVTFDPGTSGGPAPVGSPVAGNKPVTPLPRGSRYGESVVRELLGARFIEERPLPQSRE